MTYHAYLLALDAAIRERAAAAIIRFDVVGGTWTRGRQLIRATEMAGRAVRFELFTGHGHATPAGRYSGKLGARRKSSRSILVYFLETGQTVASRSGEKGTDMTPLDLRTHRPRPVRATILGFYLRCRARSTNCAPNCRAATSADYLNHDTGFSAYVVRRMGLDMDDFRAAVAAAPDEEAVVAWLAARIDAALAPGSECKTRVLRRRTHVAPKIRRSCANAIRSWRIAPSSRVILDILDADDELTFADDDRTAALPTYYHPARRRTVAVHARARGATRRISRRFCAACSPTRGAAPRAILVVSGHWEEPVPTVTSRPRLLDALRLLRLPRTHVRAAVSGAGFAEVAARVGEALAAAGIPSATEHARGYDHGVFVPFMLVAPEATIPVVPLSLVTGLDPAQHLALGRALAPLRREGDPDRRQRDELSQSCARSTAAPTCWRARSASMRG